MAVSDQDIQNWFAANPNATANDIASAAAQYGVSANQLDTAMGWGGTAQNWVNSQDQSGLIGSYGTDFGWGGATQQAQPEQPAPVYTPAPQNSWVDTSSASQPQSAPQQVTVSQPQVSTPTTQTAAQAASTPAWNATTAGAGGLPPNVTQAGLSKFQGLINAGNFQDAYNMGTAAGYNPNDLASYVNQNWGGQFGNLTGDYLTQMYGAGKGPNGPDYSKLGPYNPADPYNPNNRGPNSQYASGWGGYQPAGSAFVGDNPMPESERLKIPQKVQNEQAVVNAYFNEQLKQAQKNGYSTDAIMNNWNGYLSGKLDPQIKGSILSSANNYFQSAVPGWSGYVTNDWGFTTIPRGAEQLTVGGKYNTSAPTFSKAFDANQSHDSLFMPNTLYDYINAYGGWAPGSPNYADPKNRTAALNTRLTDAQIKEFQDNPSAAIAKYGAGVKGAAQPGVNYAPGGYSASGGAASPAGTGLIGSASGGYGAGGAGSGYGQGYSPSSSYSSTSNISNAYGGNIPVALTQVDPNTELVENRIASLANPDNPLNQKIRTAVLERANQRGLLNSSIAEGAAESAILDNAQQIAATDAATYTNTRWRNQADQNAFAGREQSQIYTLAQQDKAFQNTLQLTDKNFANSMTTLQTQFQNSLTSMDKQMEQWKQQYGITRASELQNSYMNSVSNAYQTYVNQVNKIQSSDLTPEEKTQQIQQAAMLRNNAINFNGSVVGSAGSSYWNSAWSLLTQGG